MSLSSRSWFRGLAATSAVAVFAVAGGAAALADDISNNLDSSLDATAEVMPLNVDGDSGTTTLYVAPTGVDGKSGCNLTGATTVSVSVNSSNTSVATVSPGALTFTSCGDTKTITVTPIAQGTATVSLRQTSNTTGGTFNLAPASFTVNVAPPANTAPEVTVTGVVGGASYEKGSVPAPVCSVTDAEDGPQSFAASLSAITGPLSSYGLGSQTATCAYEDAGGLEAVTSATYSIVDTTKPVLSLPGNQIVEATGPSGAVLAFTATATDTVGPPSPAVSCAFASGDTFELGTTTVNCSATDAAGNTATGSFTVTVRDTTAPKVTVPTNITTEATGPSGAMVTFEATATDAVTSDPDVTCDPASGDTFALGTTTVKCSATDAAGNTGTGSFTVTVQDTTAPAITWVGGPLAGEAYMFGSVPAAGTCTALDVVDTDPVCTVSGYSTAVGNHTLTATAKDFSGNTRTATRTYSVLAWTLNGFYSPVDMNGVLNTVKGGSTVPLKFEVLAGSTELTDKAAVKGFTVKNVACPGSTYTDDIELVTSGATSLRYDTTAGQFIQNWQTPKNPGACYTVTMETLDGSTISANFKLK